MFCISFPFIFIVPFSALARHITASTSSSWPFPSTPAMPSISPLCTFNESPFTASRPRLSLTERLSISKTVFPGCAGVLSTISLTECPTIFSASVSSSTFWGLTVSINLPLRIMVHTSEDCCISLSLCVMRIIVLPFFTRLCMIPIKSSISCGVSTAVGSSRIRISTPL